MLCGGRTDPDRLAMSSVHVCVSNLAYIPLRAMPLGLVRGTDDATGVRGAIPAGGHPRMHVHSSVQSACVGVIIRPLV